LGGLDASLVTTIVPASGGSSCPDSVALHTYYTPLNRSITTDAFMMAPGSTAAVCITYHFEKAGTFIPVTGILACGPFSAAEGNLSSGCSGQVAASTSESPLFHLAGLNLTVAYTLRASANAEGAFWFWVDCGEFFPVVVVPRPASLTFPIISGCVYEPNALGAGTVVGASNLEVAPIPVA